MFVVIYQSSQTIGIAEYQGPAFVSRETPREANGEYLRVEQLIGALDFQLRGATALQLLFESFAREKDQSFTAAIVNAP